jgi:hypothetical protein
MTAKTPAERKAAERARRLKEGLEELRGIYAPKTQHAALKAELRRIMAESKEKK